jgi:hypothetical protein
MEMGRCAGQGGSGGGSPMRPDIDMLVSKGWRGGVPSLRRRSNGHRWLGRLLQHGERDRT